MKSLKKAMILSLSLVMLSQTSYASGQIDKEDTGCGCFSFWKCLFKTTRILEPLAETALQVAASATDNPELSKVAHIMNRANQAIGKTESVLLGENGEINFLAGGKAAAGGIFDVLDASGQGQSRAAKIFEKMKDGLSTQVEAA